MEEEKCCCHHKTKERSEKEYKDLIHRLNRIEGQIRGIKGMVEKDAYCPEILVQVAAANAALNSFNKVLLAKADEVMGIVKISGSVLRQQVAQCSSTENLGGYRKETTVQ